MAKQATPLDDVRDHFALPNGRRPSRKTVSLWVSDAGARNPDGTIDLQKIERLLEGQPRSDFRKNGPQYQEQPGVPESDDLPSTNDLQRARLAAEVRERNAKADMAEMERDRRRGLLIPVGDFLPIVGSVISEHCHFLDASSRTVAGLANPAEPERANQEIQRFIEDAINQLRSRFTQAVERLSNGTAEDYDDRGDDDGA